MNNKIELVRKNILIAVQKYKEELVGRRFLYIFDDKCIEVIFKIESFMHLTGVDSKSLRPKEFYKKAKDKTLKRNHMFFSARHPLKVALRKSEELVNIDVFSKSKVFVVMDLKTNTYTYAFSFSDKKITLGLTKDIKEDSSGNKIQLDYYVPRTFRVKEDITEGRDKNKVKEVIMILSKIDAQSKYNKVHYIDKVNFELLPKGIKDKIDEEVINYILKSKISESIVS